MRGLASINRNVELVVAKDGVIPLPQKYAALTLTTTLLSVFLRALELNNEKLPAIVETCAGSASRAVIVD